MISSVASKIITGLGKATHLPQAMMSNTGTQNIRNINLSEIKAKAGTATEDAARHLAKTLKRFGPSEEFATEYRAQLKKAAAGPAGMIAVESALLFTAALSKAAYPEVPLGPYISVPVSVGRILINSARLGLTPAQALHRTIVERATQDKTLQPGTKTTWTISMKLHGLTPVVSQSNASFACPRSSFSW